MANQVKPVRATDRACRGHLGYLRWTLCLGAGGSSQVVPSWLELARRLTNSVFGTLYTEAVFKDLVFRSGWGLDSWIQAAANHHQLRGGTPADFQVLVRDILYSDLLTEAKTAGVDSAVLAALNWPRQTTRRQVEAACAFFEARYGQTSLMALVRWLTACNKKGNLPYAIITFNAEPVLHSVFELFQRRDHFRGPPPHSHPEYCFTRITRPHFVPRDADTNPDKVRKIPIYHCHGALIPKTGSPRPAAAENNLVFLEQEYLKVSTTAATWPETLFMFHAQLSKMLFVGLSMSDPNLRRWLGLSAEAAKATPIRRGEPWGPPHIWLTTEPTDPGLQQVSLVGLFHLGVRPAWIRDWPELEPALHNLTATA
jgi:hypothetical protein